MRKALRFSLLLCLFVLMAGAGAYMTLTLIIKGEEPVVVPDLEGKDVLYVLETLSDLGLNTRVRGTVYHATVPKNHVIDQDPEPGTSIKQGRDVKIRVSRGPERIAMPNLTGLSLQQSKVLLAENGLCQGAVSAMTGSRYTSGQVMSQHPMPGATIARNECVDLLVSRGPRSAFFSMPDMLGRPASKTIRELETLQLKMNRIRSLQAANVPRDAVVEQSPLSGYRVNAGQPVDLAVNRQAFNQQAGKTIPGERAELIRLFLENGFLKKRVRVTIQRQKTTIGLFDDYMPPGQEIWLLIPKGDTSTLRVVVDGQLVMDPMEMHPN